MTAPLVHATHQAIEEAINNAIRADARIRELIALARSAPTPEAFAAAVAEGGELLAQSEAGPLLGIGACVDVVYQCATIEFPVGADGTLEPVRSEVRVIGIPGIEGHVLWVLTGDGDVETMRRALEPGQVWVRADLVKSDDWPRVRALAADAGQRMLGLVRARGRRPGSVNVAREALLSQIRATPDMSNGAIDDFGVKAGIWSPSLGDYLLVRQRVSRARKDAAPIKP